MLAGFSFTLLVLLLPSIDNETRTATPDGFEVAMAGPFSGAPQIAAVLFLAAGVFLVGSVQAAIHLRMHAVSPSELEEWLPHNFRESREPSSPDNMRQEDEDEYQADGLPIAVPSFWKTDDGWTHRRVGDHWFGAQARQWLHEELAQADRWAWWTRLLYHCGIVALLAGLTALVSPPHDQWSAWRYVIVAVAGLATAVELCWIAVLSIQRSPAAETVRQPTGSGGFSQRWLGSGGASERAKVMIGQPAGRRRGARDLSRSDCVHATSECDHRTVASASRTA